MNLDAMRDMFSNGWPKARERGQRSDVEVPLAMRAANPHPSLCDLVDLAQAPHYALPSRSNG